MDKNTKKNRVKIKQATKVRSILQQEINSTCPFCSNDEVGHFHIHHIDENPENNELSNLFLLCPTCHSKITKDDISRKEVEQTKITSSTRKNIECATISIDSKNCSWDNYDNVENAFINNHTDKSEFPILNFSLINHTTKTILFKEIKLKAKHLYSGLSGITQPRILKSIAKFKIELPDGNKISTFSLTDEIEVPVGQAFKFQIQVFKQWNDDVFPIDGRKVLYFTFGFNNKLSLNAPTIFLNCKSKNEKMKLVILS
ncbi:MAG: HNH endonuclease [Flavobacteriales bacterium]|nr:HNH endonuclease [Flavobacteriales bacterium]